MIFLTAFIQTDGELRYLVDGVAGPLDQAAEVRSHTVTVPSAHVVRTFLSSDRKTADQQRSRWPLSMVTCSALAPSQSPTIADPSQLAVTIKLPS